MGQGACLLLVTQPAEQVPAGVAVKQVGLIGGQFGQDVVQPGRDPFEFGVEGRQDPDRGEQVTQVVVGPANCVNRRTNRARSAMVFAPSNRDPCCRPQPVSIPSKTAASSSRCATPATRTSPAEPGMSTTRNHPPVVTGEAILLRLP